MILYLLTDYTVQAVKNLLPEAVAVGLSDYLNELGENKWTISSSETDATMYKGVGKGAGSTQHAFSASEGIIINSNTAARNAYSDDGESTVMDKFLCILAKSFSRVKNEEEVVFTLQCGRYSSGHYIEPHDDQAQEEVDGILYERDIAIVFYLSQGWKASNGGLFVDLQSNPPRPRVPAFNSLVTFKVPRLHQVSPIEVDCNARRYSIFGWALKKSEIRQNISHTRKKKRNKKMKRGKKSRNE